MSPDLDSLRCFEAAATHLSFRVAARAVALSPTAFSDRIKRLEETLGGALFARTTRRIVLTPAGERLVPHARKLIADCDRCAEIVRGDAKPAPYSLSIGTRFELGISWLTPALEPLAALRPERTIHLAFGDSPDLISKIRNGLLDAAVTSVRLAVAGFDYEVLHDEDYVFVGTAGLLKRQPLRGAGDAAAHTLVDAAPDLPLFRYFLDARAGGEAWTFSKIEYLGTIGAIRIRVLQGAGVAVLPRYFVARDLAARRLVRIAPRTELKRDAFRLIWRTGIARERELRMLGRDLASLPLR